MSLELIINNDIKTAMKAKEDVTLRGLRAIKSAILLAKTAEGASENISTEDEIKLLSKLVKQRRDRRHIGKRYGQSNGRGKQTIGRHCRRQTNCRTRKNITYLISITAAPNCII